MPTSASSLAAIGELLPFVQLDFAGRLGPDDGRYLIRSADGSAEHVLVVGGPLGLAAGMRRGRRRRRRSSRTTPAGATPEVPITRLTVIRPGSFGGSQAAEAWLAEVGASEERSDELIGEALRIANRALHAWRLATQDPYGARAAEALTLTRRVGFGTGDELADGRWSEAIEVPAAPGPRRRADALGPQERMAAALGRRETPLACEVLLLRARADLDGDRPREAALQLRVGLEALLAEIKAKPPTGAGKGAGAELASEQAAAQVADLEALRERRSMTGDAANEALRGEVSGARAAEVTETLRVCERILRRRRILGR